MCICDTVCVCMCVYVCVVFLWRYIIAQTDILQIAYIFRGWPNVYASEINHTVSIGDQSIYGYFIFADYNYVDLVILILVSK